MSKLNIEPIIDELIEQGYGETHAVQYIWQVASEALSEAKSDGNAVLVQSYRNALNALLERGISL